MTADIIPQTLREIMAHISLILDSSSTAALAEGKHESMIITLNQERTKTQAGFGQMARHSVTIVSLENISQGIYAL